MGAQTYARRRGRYVDAVNAYEYDAMMTDALTHPTWDHRLIYRLYYTQNGVDETENAARPLSTYKSQ